MYVKLLGSFNQCAVTPEGGQGHFGLKRRGVISSFSLAHFLSLSVTRNMAQKSSLIIRDFLSNGRGPVLSHQARFSLPLSFDFPYPKHIHTNFFTGSQKNIICALVCILAGMAQNFSCLGKAVDRLGLPPASLCYYDSRFGV